MSAPPIILASGSQSRRALLAGAGLGAEAIAPNVDEDAAKTAMRRDGVTVRDQAMHLAELKAIKVSRHNSGLVIGGDQMLSLDGLAFDKPADLGAAKDHLRQLSGKTHTLETAIVICEDGEPVWRHLARPKLTVRNLSEPFIETYVAQCGEALLSTVGAYQLEARGAQLFARIEGDYFSILGLPLLPLLDYLRTRGVIET
ncbi:MAG: Maf family protein [Pseudomonadota bacterium]